MTEWLDIKPKKMPGTKDRNVITVSWRVAHKGKEDPQQPYLHFRLFISLGGQILTRLGLQKPKRVKTQISADRKRLRLQTSDVKNDWALVYKSVACATVIIPIHGLQVERKRPTEVKYTLEDGVVTIELPEWAWPPAVVPVAPSPVEIPFPLAVVPAEPPKPASAVIDYATEPLTGIINQDKAYLLFETGSGARDVAKMFNVPLEAAMQCRRQWRQETQQTPADIAVEPRVTPKPLTGDEYAATIRTQAFELFNADRSAREVSKALEYPLDMVNDLHREWRKKNKR